MTINTRKILGITSLSALILGTPFIPKSIEHHKQAVSNVKHQTFIDEEKDTFQSVCFNYVTRLNGVDEKCDVFFNWNKIRNYEKFKDLKDGDIVEYQRIFMISPAVTIYHALGGNKAYTQPLGWSDWSAYKMVNKK